MFTTNTRSAGSAVPGTGDTVSCLKCVYKQIWGFASLSRARRLATAVRNKSYQNKHYNYNIIAYSIILPWEIQKTNFQYQLTQFSNDFETTISVWVKLKASYHLIPDQIWQEITPPINVLNTILILAGGQSSSHLTHYLASQSQSISMLLTLMLPCYSYRDATQPPASPHH